MRTKKDVATTNPAYWSHKPGGLKLLLNVCSREGNASELVYDIRQVCPDDVEEEEANEGSIENKKTEESLLSGSIEGYDIKY